MLTNNAEKSEIEFLFSNFKIESLIVHSIIYENDKQKKPEYSESLTTLDEKGIRILGNRIIDAVGAASNAIEMSFIVSDDSDEINKNQTCFELLVPFFNENISDDVFIDITKNLTTKLFIAQKVVKNVPDGAILFIKGTSGRDAKKCFVIIKAEIHDGFLFNTEDNKSVVELIEKLILTPLQKLYKVAFILDNKKDNDTNREYSPTDVRVFVYDSNVGSSDVKSAANYFYNGFLMCDYSNDSAVLNQKFYDTTHNFLIEKYADDVEKRWNFLSYLKAYMNNTDKIVSMKKFATEYFHEEGDRKKYYAYMKENGGPVTAISKDLKRVRAKMTRRTVKFSNGVSITASESDFNDNVIYLNTVLKNIISESEFETLSETLQLDKNTILKISGMPLGEK